MNYFWGVFSNLAEIHVSTRSWGRLDFVHRAHAMMWSLDRRRWTGGGGACALDAVLFDGRKDGRTRRF